MNTQMHARIIYLRRYVQTQMDASTHDFTYKYTQKLKYTHTYPSLSLYVIATHSHRHTPNTRTNTHAHATYTHTFGGVLLASFSSYAALGAQTCGSQTLLNKSVIPPNRLSNCRHTHIHKQAQAHGTETDAEPRVTQMSSNQIFDLGTPGIWGDRQQACHSRVYA